MAGASQALHVVLEEEGDGQHDHLVQMGCISERKATCWSPNIPKIYTMAEKKALTASFVVTVHSLEEGHFRRIDTLSTNPKAGEGFAILFCREHTQDCRPLDENSRNALAALVDQEIFSPRCPFSHEAFET
jgi:hypothetical protein